MAKTKVKPKYKTFRLRDISDITQTSFEGIKQAYGILTSQLILEKQHWEDHYNYSTLFCEAKCDSARIAQQLYAERKGLA